MLKQAGNQRFLIVLFTCLLVLGVNIFWLFSGEPLQSESAPRMVFGAIVIFFLPGIIWGEALGFKSSHFLETISISFVLTLFFNIILITANLLLEMHIYFFVYGLLLISIIGLVLLAIKTIRNHELVFLQPLFHLDKDQPFLFISNIIILIMLAALSYGTYNWGENIYDISGEKLLHMLYIRYYYSMPLILNELAIHPGAPPPNFIHLWEYLIAAWAWLINTDPLYVFYRARFIIPIIGLSGLYYLLSSLFNKRVKLATLYWIIIIMCMGNFIMLSPSLLDWIKKGDPFRQVMSFMGTVHHADSAMDILIVMNLSIFIIALRNFNWKNVLLLFSISISTLMWHPREYFQNLIYIGVLGIIVLAYHGRESLKRWAIASASVLLIAIVFLGISHFVVPKGAHAYDEMKIKKTAIEYAFSSESITIRNIFNFPSSIVIAFATESGENKYVSLMEISKRLKGEWNTSLYLILSACSIPIILLLGKLEDKKFIMFYSLLWLMALSVNFTLFIIMALTYSEIFMTTSRIIYIFGYISIALSFYLIVNMTIEGKDASKKYTLLKILFVALILGCSISLWWNANKPLWKYLLVLLNIMVLVSILLYIFSRRIKLPFPWKITAVENGHNGKKMLLTIVTFILFVTPVMYSDLKENMKKILTERRNSIDWFGINNPFKYSQDLIGNLKLIPIKSNFLVDPLGNDCIFIYCPQYVSVVPSVILAVINEFSNYEECKNGKNPVFRSETIDHENIVSYITQNKIDYIFVKKNNYIRLKEYFYKHPDIYYIQYENKHNLELIVKLLK